MRKIVFSDFIAFSVCVLLRLYFVAVSSRWDKGWIFFFFFLGTDFISLWERLYFVVLLHFLFCVFIQIVGNNFTYERRVASMCSLMSREREGVKKKEQGRERPKRKNIFFIQLLRYFLYQENFTVTASKKILEKFWLLQRKSPKLNKVINKVSDTRCTGVNILMDPTGPLHIRVRNPRSIFIFTYGYKIRLHRLLNEFLLSLFPQPSHYLLLLQK